MKTPVFTGVSTAIITPFRDGKVDLKKFAELIDFQIENGVSAITVCGTTGERSTQSLEEHVETVNFCIDRVAGRIKVIAGTGSNNTLDAVFLSQEAEKSGADALLMSTPYYNKTSQRGLVQHFTYVADRVNIPIILYNVPSRTGMSFTAAAYKALSKHPMINGVKEASGDFSLVADTRALCGDDLFIWSGNDDHAVPMMSMGGKGVICTCSNIIPKQMSEICSLALAGDFKAASDLALRYTDIMHILFIEVNPMPLKAAMNMIGMDVGMPRMPLCDLAPENAEKLRLSLKNAGLI